MADDRDGDFEQCTPSQKDSPKGSQRRSGSNLSDGERMFHRRSCIDSSMEIPVVAESQIEEGNDGLEYYYDIVVIILSAELEGRCPRRLLSLSSSIKSNSTMVVGGGRAVVVGDF